MSCILASKKGVGKVLLTASYLLLLLTSWSHTYRLCKRPPQRQFRKTPTSKHVFISTSEMCLNRVVISLLYVFPYHIHGGSGATHLKGRDFSICFEKNLRTSKPVHSSECGNTLFNRPGWYSYLERAACRRSSSAIFMMLAE